MKPARFLRLRVFGTDICVSFWFFAALIIFIISGREALAAYFLLPAALHELGHAAAMALCGVRIEAVSFRAFGIDIKRGAVSVPYWKDIAICLGGVAANLMTALCFYFFAFQSVRVILFIAVNAVVAIFNAMPVANLDGGQILRLLLERFGNPSIAYGVSRAFSLLLLAPLFAASIFLMLRGFANTSLIAACLYLAGIVIFKE